MATPRRGQWSLADAMILTGGVGLGLGAVKAISAAMLRLRMLAWAPKLVFVHIAIVLILAGLDCGRNATSAGPRLSAGDLHLLVRCWESRPVDSPSVLAQLADSLSIENWPCAVRLVEAISKRWTSTLSFRV